MRTVELKAILLEDMEQQRPGIRAELGSINFMATPNFLEVPTSWLESNPFILVLVASCTLYYLHYQLSWLVFHQRSRASGVTKTPPLVPHGLPMIGNIPLGLLFNPQRFVRSSKYLFWSSSPVRVKWMARGFYIIQGHQNLISIFNQQHISASVFRGHLLRYVFGMSWKASNMRFRDDSGDSPKPIPGTNIEPRNRVSFHIRQSTRCLLTGSGIRSLMEKYQSRLNDRLHDLEFNSDWTYHPSFENLAQTLVMSAAVDAVCGTTFLSRHPNFIADFWTVDNGINALLMGMPRLFAREAYEARERGLTAVKQWQQWARENFDPDTVDADLNDPFWGTEFFRNRQKVLSEIDNFDIDDIAAEDFGFLWGMNSNAVKAAFWSVLEVFRDPELLRQVRKEVEACIRERMTSTIRFDIPALLQQPLLQAIFAETVRLRVHGVFVRYLNKSPLNVDGWTIPRDHFIIGSSTPAHMNPEVWSTGQNEGHPVDEFWPGRFLKPKNSEGSKAADVQFTTAGKEGHWIPFGGGTHACPGKNFARQESLFFIALMTTMFDCEILAEDQAMEMSTRNYGLGLLVPSGKLPFRIRRRTSVEV